MIYLDLNDNRSEIVKYDCADYPIFAHKLRLSSYPDYAAPSHWHDDIEFIYILSGVMSYHVNGKVLSLEAGEGILVNSRQIHFGFSDERLECEFLCILVHPLLLCSVPQMEREFISPLIHDNCFPYVKLSGMLEWQRHVIECFQKIYEDRDSAASPLKAQAMFAFAWALIFENLPRVLPSIGKSSTDLDIMKKMLLFVQQNYEKKISLAEIAKAGAVGESKCCQLFRQYLSQTPVDSLIHYRLNKALELLAGTKKPITEIAADTGFGGASYFTEVFRRRMGCTPREYRRQNAGVI